MKHKISEHSIQFFIPVFLLVLTSGYLFANSGTDSLYLPPIKITSLNGYGPFVLGSERSNLFIIYQVPMNTSKIIMKMIDSKGIQVNKAYTETGSGIQEASWGFDSDTMGLPLSPQLSIEVHYQSDSIAIYNIPYTVYPDTVTMNASAGFGPFTTNDYQLSDTLWHPVPQQFNNFTIKHLPPRTDTIEFQIMTIDSVIVCSTKVTAPPGTWLDSAVYKNVRMDQLPLDAKYLRVLVWCQGGPVRGLEYHKELMIMPQSPKLICISDSLVTKDSMSVFVENQIGGQALAVDSVKHALIQNGPGQRNIDNHIKTIYPGPYSIDVLESNFSVEAWMKFNLTGLTQDVKTMNLMTVDSVWQLYIEVNVNGALFGVSSLADIDHSVLWTVPLTLGQLMGEGWHHVAFTCFYDNTGNYPVGKFYLDGLPLPDVNFDDGDYDYIQTYLDWRQFMNTQPLILGGNNPGNYSLVTAMDEVRIWSKTLSENEIWYNYQRSPLQEIPLEGYWNFDDLRNRLNYISDRSYNNNFGNLENKAYFIPQFPTVQRTVDTIKIFSSNIHTDSVRYFFIDRNNVILDSCTKFPTMGKSLLEYDVEALPYNISKLKIREYYHPSAGMVLETLYNLQSYAPEPIATPQYNWNTYYSTPATMGKTYAPVTVSGFPDNTRKVTLGLMNGMEVYDTMTFTSNSVPFHHSLTLNGTDNYVQTTQEINAPGAFSIMFWMKTTTGTGGKIIGFTDNQNGGSTTNHDREIILENDGSLRFNILDEGAMKTLYALNINNDGNWHHVAVTVDGNQDASIYVDGSLSQRLKLTSLTSYQGWWIIGRNGASDNSDANTASEYFSGSLCEISVWNRALANSEINTFRYQSSVDPDEVLYYKFNENAGDTIVDHAGSNTGIVNGSAPAWFLANQISFVTWNTNITELQPGVYTFFATVNYPFGPAAGASYQLGNFVVAEAFPDYMFNFFLSEGEGFFNQGISLMNTLSFETNYTGSAQPGWSKNYIKYNFFTFDHELISSDSVNYTSSSFSGQFDIDMGDAPPGSFISLEAGYFTSGSLEISENSVAIPIYIHPMVPPTVNGYFGPFDQAIAPACMQRPNTFTLSMEPLTDMDSIAAIFYDVADNQIGRCRAVKVSDTIWTVTYDMSLLSPPVTNMTLEYYLGQDIHPAAVEGPYPITIHKTRPAWFDFLPSGNFSNIQQSGGFVTFSVTTPFEKNWLINDSVELDVPEWIPLVGGTKSILNSPTAEAYLKYDISAHTLELNQPPEFYQGITQLGASIPGIVNFGFNASMNDSYGIDAQNNLIATQNFKIGGSVTTNLFKIENIAKKIGQLINMSSIVDPASIVVKPSFQLSATADFEYASRLHIMVDTLSGNWGSFGNLIVDANPSHGQAYQNSASYHFYSGAYGLEFSVGAQFFEGLATGYFGLDGRVVIGYGHSYITIPANNTRPLKSAAFQVYGRFYLDLFWGWYEKNLWGPNLFYSANIWGDDMSPCFPPLGKKNPGDTNIIANSSWCDLSGEIMPVSEFSKMSQPAPHQSIGSSDENMVLTWLERGPKYGERIAKLGYMLSETKKFSENINIEINKHGINNPVSDAVTNNQVLLCWAQTRYDNETILGVSESNVLPEFLKAQDIWYAVYDIPRKKVIQLNRVIDDTLTMTSGRAEANPFIVSLSETKALIVWQVADLDNHRSGIWYVKLEKQEDRWLATEPALITDLAGVKTKLSIAVPETNKAIIAWINTTGERHDDKKLMTSEFDGFSWSEPSELLAMQGNQFCNYFDMKFNNGKGAVAVTTFVDDPGGPKYEKLILLPWDSQNKRWSTEQTVEALREPTAHLQLPRIAINKNGHATIAFKVERIGRKTANERISQIDLLTGNLNDPSGKWKHIKGNEFVCDTSKQVAEIALSYIDHDTLLILSNEFPMFASNSYFTPQNGIMYGDRYMNLVLRCFAIESDSIVRHVPESVYFVGINDHQLSEQASGLLQNYPNPCKESTKVKFDVTERSNVKLELFDVRGKQVATLVDQELPAGSYEIKLNTSLLKPGIYTCRMINGMRVDAIKIDVVN
ncbi:MAG: LamG-like jellyroll fold domain-containing protein [Bacteroidota bacterium]